MVPAMKMNSQCGKISTAVTDRSDAQTMARFIFTAHVLTLGLLSSVSSWPSTLNAAPSDTRLPDRVRSPDEIIAIGSERRGLTPIVIFFRDGKRWWVMLVFERNNSPANAGRMVELRVPRSPYGGLMHVSESGESDRHNKRASTQMHSIEADFPGSGTLGSVYPARAGRVLQFDSPAVSGVKNRRSAVASQTLLADTDVSQSRVYMIRFRPMLYEVTKPISSESSVERILFDMIEVPLRDRSLVTAKRRAGNAQNAQHSPPVAWTWKHHDAVERVTHLPTVWSRFAWIALGLGAAALLWALVLLRRRQRSTDGGRRKC